MPVEMPRMCQRNRLDLQCPPPQNPRSRAGGRPETPESIAVDFGSHQQPLMGSEPAEQRPRCAPWAGPGKAGLGREGKALEAELLPREGMVSRKAAIRGHTR